MKNYDVAQLGEIEPTRCPCGYARRAFMHEGNELASLHVVQIEEDSKLHYHKKMTEIYFVLEGEGTLEVDGDIIPLKPETSVMIRPGCRHRARGKGLKLINVPIPKFDPEDEWFD